MNSGHGSRTGLIGLRGALLIFGLSSLAMAANAADKNEAGTSPWLAVPMVSSDPKIGTSGGGMVGYLFKLDPESTSSMVGAGATYSTTDSYGGGLFLRSFWDQDSKRLTVFGGGGNIKNDYEDFLGSGQSAQTTDDVRILMARYLQQLRGNWFAGIQATYTNYLIYSENGDVNEALKTLGLTGFDSVAVGLVAVYDSRNNQNSPSSGQHLQIDNYAYRESLGGEEDFDVYNLKYSQYLPHGDGNVLAYRFEGRWTEDASAGGYSSVNLRGYTKGQYLAPHASLIEVEERWHLFGRYSINLFAGLACLYGDGLDCSTSDNIYPSAGVGGQVMINHAEKIAMTFDLAFGKSDNNGFYMRFGQAF